MQSLILDVFEGVFERVFLFSKTAKSDHTWEPVLRYIRKTLKVPEEEECFFEEFDPEVINGIIEQQKRIIDYEKKHNFKKLHQICIIVDDFAGDEGVMRGKRGEALKNVFARFQWWEWAETQVVEFLRCPFTFSKWAKTCF